MFHIRPYCRVLLFVCSSASLLSMAGCHQRTEKGGPGSEGRNHSGPKFMTLYKSPSSYFIGTVREAIRDPTRWRTAWDSAYRYKHPPTAFPEVDFQRYMVLLAAGPTGGPGDSVVINQVTETEESLRVHVTAYQHCSPQMASMEPVHVVRLQRSEQAVIFENEFVRGINCIPDSQ